MYQMMLLYTVTLLLGVFVRENECIAAFCNGLHCPSTYVTCPETPVEVMCNITESSTSAHIYWTLPPGSCPDKNDTLTVIVGRKHNCQDKSDTCGPFIQRNVPNWSQDGNYTCSSILTVPRNTSATIQCRGDELDLKNITIIRNSLTLDAVSDNEAAIALTWTPSFNCCVATYNVTINTTLYVVPGSQQGYYISGLTSNTLYVINLTTFYCNSSTSVYTLASPPQNVNISIIMGSGIYTSLNVTWTAVLGVSRYKVYEGSPNALGFPSANGVLCTTGTCAFLINLNSTIDLSGADFVVCVSSLNVVLQNGTANCIYIAGTTSAPSTPSASSTPSSLAITGFRFSEYLFRAIIPACVFVYMCVCL